MKIGQKSPSPTTKTLKTFHSFNNGAGGRKALPYQKKIVHCTFTKDLMIIQNICIFFIFIQHIGISMLIFFRYWINDGIQHFYTQFSWMADEKPMSCAVSGTNIWITYYKLNEWMKQLQLIKFIVIFFYILILGYSVVEHYILKDNSSSSIMTSGTTTSSSLASTITSHKTTSSTHSNVMASTVHSGI